MHFDVESTIYYNDMNIKKTEISVFFRLKLYAETLVSTNAFNLNS